MAQDGAAHGELGLPAAEPGPALEAHHELGPRGVDPPLAHAGHVQLRAGRIRHRERSSHAQEQALWPIAQDHALGAAEGERAALSTGSLHAERRHGVRVDDQARAPLLVEGDGRLAAAEAILAARHGERAERPHALDLDLAADGARLDREPLGIHLQGDLTLHRQDRGPERADAEGLPTLVLLPRQDQRGTLGRGEDPATRAPLHQIDRPAAGELDRGARRLEEQPAALGAEPLPVDLHLHLGRRRVDAALQLREDLW